MIVRPGRPVSKSIYAEKNMRRQDRTRGIFKTKLAINILKLAESANKLQLLRGFAEYHPSKSHICLLYTSDAADE